MGNDNECSFPDIEKYTLEQLDELIIEAQRILKARDEKPRSLSRWLLLQAHHLSVARAA